MLQRREEQKLRQGLTRIFLKERAAIVNVFNGLRAAATPINPGDLKEVNVQVGRILNITKPTKEKLFRVALTPVVKSHAKQINSGFEDFNIKVKMPIVNKETIKFLDTHLPKITGQIDKATRQRVSGIVQRGIDRGDSVSAVSELVGDVFTNMSSSRARLIAQVETGIAASTGDFISAKASGLDLLKVWSSAGDALVRPSHQIHEAVGMNDTFSNGLLYPMDPNGPIEEIANCRCTLLFIPKDEAASWGLGPGDVPQNDPVVADAFAIGPLPDDPKHPAFQGQKKLNTMLRSNLSEDRAKDTYMPSSVDAFMNDKVKHDALKEDLFQQLKDDHLLDEWRRKGNDKPPLEEQLRDLVTDDLIKSEVRNHMEGDVGFWAMTSGDGDPQAIAMQMSAREEFQLTNAVTNHMTPTRGHALNLEDELQHWGGIHKSEMRSMYERTQKELVDAGIDEVVVYRGMNVDVDVLYPGKSGTFIDDVVSQPMTSFSTSLEKAQLFAFGKNGVIVSAKVPRSRILSTYRTGFGKKREQEVVLLGGKDKMTIRLLRRVLE